MTNINKYTADEIFIDKNTILTDAVIVTNTNGQILAIDKSSVHDASTVRRYHGSIVPGFVNTHCHLELSHLKNVAPTGTGLIPFIKSVITLRKVDQEIIDQAIIDGDKEMYKAGIVAVGDICNQLDTVQVKNTSKILYHSFVEMFDFIQPSMTQRTIDQYQPMYEGQSDINGNKKTLVPHSPYTVSKDLFAYINAHNPKGSIVSIHNQETPAENEIFELKTGKFIDFYTDLGMNMDGFKTTGKTSIHYTLEHLSSDFSTIFVHNTMTTRADIKAALAWNKNIFWATCANANLYIENRLPDYTAFLDTKATVTIGTDSLTSNWQLSIWEEIKTIAKYASYLPLTELITWATANGAKALGYDEKLGNIAAGKAPGLVHVDTLISQPSDLQKSEARRID